MKIAIIIVTLGIFASGCAQLLRLQGQATEKAAQGIEAYCKNTDPSFRTVFEAEMNAKAAPHSASITCAQ